MACALWGVAQHGPQTPSSGSHGRGNNHELPRGRLAFVASATELGSQCGDAHGPLAAACITVIHSHPRDYTVVAVLVHLHSLVHCGSSLTAAYRNQSPCETIAKSCSPRVRGDCQERRSPHGQTQDRRASPMRSLLMWRRRLAYGSPILARLCVLSLRPFSAPYSKVRGVLRRRAPSSTGRGARELQPHWLC